MKTKIELVCPKCEAHLSVDAKREFLYCEYCGTKILLNDENTYTFRHVAEAEVLYAETDRIVRLKELELAEKKADSINETNEKQKKFAKYLVCFAAPIMAISFIFYLISKEFLFIIPATFGFLLLDIALILLIGTFFPE